jgi:hypothetical protein
MLIAINHLALNPNLITYFKLTHLAPRFLRT